MHPRQKITIEPGKQGRKPCIRGLRITVYDELEMSAQEMSHAKNLENFTELEAKDITSHQVFAANRERNLYTLTFKLRQHKTPSHRIAKTEGILQ